MFETMVAFVMPEHVAGRTFEPPLGPSGYARIINAQRRPFPTKDGYLCVMPYTTAQWLRFLRLAGLDELAADPAIADPAERSRRFEELYGVVAAALPARTTQEWIGLLEAHDILFGQVNSPEDLLSDPHLQAMGMFPCVEHPTEGPLRLLGFPINYSRTPNTLRRLPPTLGQHTDEVLGELGYSTAEINRLRDEGAATGG